ncbi:DUF6544 family protein [Pseudaminobacter sp. NGMCC 1.201702]|uniref:DUF6544 family protein n=1 Tax=Pseudaminobacter sp. NGMCC 1.201702 TaxID=3391825 RepID=UPI0039EEB371
MTSKTIWHEQAFEVAMVSDLPLAARRFFLFAMKPGTPLRTVAELKITGDLRPEGLSDTVTIQNYQVLAAPHGSLSRYSSIGRFIPLCGTALLNEAQAMVAFWRWRLVPSWRKSRHYPPSLLFERMAVEAALWTPAALLPQNGVKWHGVSATVAKAVIANDTRSQEIEFTVKESGQLVAIRGIGAQATTAKPANFRDLEGYRLPTLVDFEASGEDAALPLLAKARLESIRFIGPWIGSSHS